MISAAVVVVSLAVAYVEGLLIVKGCKIIYREATAHKIVTVRKGRDV